MTLWHRAPVASRAACALWKVAGKMRWGERIHIFVEFAIELGVGVVVEEERWLVSFADGGFVGRKPHFQDSREMQQLLVTWGT